MSKDREYDSQQGRESQEQQQDGMGNTRRINTREVLRAQSGQPDRNGRHAVPAREIVPYDEKGSPVPARTATRAVGRPVAPRRRRPYWKPFAVGAITTLIVAIAVTVAVTVHAMNHPAAVLLKTSGPDQTTPAQSEPDSTAAAVVMEPEETPPDYKFDTDKINVLILGTDLDTARQKKGMNARSDTIMLASIDLTTKKISLISIPRDTYTKMYGESKYLGYYSKINAAFAYGGGLGKDGVAYASNTVSHFLGGIPIDYTVTFDMDLVKALVDSIGGLRYDMDLDVTISGHKFTPGWTTLDGAAVLRYARHRHTDSDFARVDRQQKVIVALFQQLKDNRQLTSVPKIYDALKANITTNMDPLQIAALAWFGMDIDPSTITRYTIPGTVMTVNGTSIVVADQNEKAQVIKEVYGVNVPFRAEESASYLKNLINQAYSSGQDIISTAQSFLSNNTAYYTADEAKGLKSAISSWNTAANRKDADEMGDCQMDVETEYNVLYGKVKSRKAAVDEGNAKIAWAQGKLTEYEGFLSDGDKSTVQALIGEVQQRLNQHDYNNIAEAASNLESGALPIFQAAKDAKNAPPPSSEPPVEKPTPTPTTSESPTAPLASATTPDANTSDAGASSAAA